jgi:hypothetical protein
MNGLIDKLASLYRKMERQFGSFVLFGLFEREEARGRWDLLLAARWLTEDKGPLRRGVFKHLQEDLDAAELAVLSHIVILDPQDKFLWELSGIGQSDGGFRVEDIGRTQVRGTFKLGPDYSTFRDCVVNGMEFRRIILFTYDPDQWEAVAERPEAVGEAA